MELKEYQKKTLVQVKRYLEALSEFKEKNDKAMQVDADLSIDFPAKAWEKIVSPFYRSMKNGLNEHLPNFYLKIPTGGGKTVLACHAIELVNRIYLKKQAGLVLWVVPTSQIYRQTLLSLRNREHPYRQALDIASGNRTTILEKMDRFSKLDTEENLIVMLLMLPSANRLNKDVLKMFKDSGAFTDFFPAEDDAKGQEALLGKYPNLDFFGKKEGIFGRVAKTSLGNTLRIIKPLIIIDEGHKAYSETARDTIRNFNPSLILELSATPPHESNILVNIHGQELNREEMIKLDLNIVNKASVEWKDAMLAAVNKRKELDKKAREYGGNTGEYIRPICLIQVERTGKEQRGKGYIHAEDAKEYLIKQCSVAEEEIAIKSSEKDDIEGIDLLGRDCPIKFIITKQALQEGWDCSFAYILAILTNPSSQLSITQLVGRILRQPNARKTKIKELDESYVFCFRQKAKDLLHNIKSGFETEGLGDLASRITVKEGDDKSKDDTKEKTIRYRDRFKPFEGHIYLPKFVIQENGSWRNVNYEMDILSRINWAQVSIGDLKKLSLSETKTAEDEITVGLDDKKVIKETKRVSKTSGMELDAVFMTRQLMDIVPNPWVAYELGSEVIDALIKKHGKQKVSNNLVFIIEEIRKQVDKEKDRLSELIFRGLIKQKKLFFFLLVDKGGYELPSSVKVKKNTKALIRDDNTPVQRSLFDFMAEEEFNEMEKAVAVYLDEQERLLWWYRNLSRQDYFIQGWRRGKVYPDFVFSTPDSTGKDYSKVFVVETKGIHLKDNDDTRYKKSIFKFCTELGKQKEWQEIHKEFSKGLEFQVIGEEEWQKRINEIFKIA